MVSDCARRSTLQSLTIATAGRQVDGAVGSLDVLPEIREAVGADWTVSSLPQVRMQAWR